MRLLSEREQVRGVVAAWLKQYPNSKNKHDFWHKIYSALKALDPERATGEDVATIVGNASWVQARPCDECGALSYGLVEMGEPRGHDSSTADLCRECLVRALALLDGATP